MPTSAETLDRTARNPDRPDHGGGVFSVLGVDLTALLAALLLILTAVSVFPSRQTAISLAAYLPLHAMVQMFAIITSILVFAAGWVAYSRERVGNSVLLSCAFLAVGLIDFAYTMAYPGMPDFVTPSSEGKAIDFWLAARALAAGALLFAAVRPWRPFASPRTRYWLLVAALGITALVYWLVMHLEGALPATFIPGQGPTPFKTGAEYTLIAVDVLAAAVFFARLRIERADYLRRLFAACSVIMLSELFFSVYGDVADINNLPGHFYNVIAYLLIYQALSVRGAQEPYQRLQQSRRPRRANMERRRRGLVSDWWRVGLSHDWYREQDGEAAQAMLAAIVENSDTAIVGCALDGTILSWNAAAERMFGWSAKDAIGQPIAIITPQQHHGLLQPLFEQAARGEPVRQVESRHLRRDGTCIDTAGTLVVIRDANGEIVFFTLTLLDITQQKQLEREVRQKERDLLESQKQFEQLAEHIPQAFWITDMQRKELIYLSLAHERIYGQRFSSLQSVWPAWRQAVHADDRGRVLAAYREMGNRGLDERFRILQPDGAMRWVHARGFPVRDANGMVYRVVGTVEDITERKFMEDALKESEERFRAAFEQAGVGMALRGVNPRNPRWLRVNQKLCDILGYTREELLQLSSIDVTPPEERQTAIDYNEKLLRGEMTSYSREKRYMRKDGQIIWTNINLTAVSGPDGRPTHIISVVQDITARLEAEKHFRLSAAVFETTQEGIMVTDASNRIILVNPAFTRITGHTPDEVIGKSPIILNSRMQDEAFYKTMWKSINDNERWQGEIWNRRKNGEIYCEWRSISTVKNAQGETLYHAAIFSDITKHKQAEESRARLAAIVEHSNDAIIGRAYDDTITSWNAAAERILGYTAAEVIGRDPVEIFPLESRPEVARHRKLIKAGHIVTNFETVRVNKDGRHINVAITFAATKDNSGRVVGTSSIVRDITDRKRAEQILRDYAARLQAVSRKLLEVQEDERRRLARELHDQVGQVLTALKINLQVTGRQADAAPLALKIENCAQIADTALQQVRTLMLDLRPPQLDELGLAAALRAHAERMVTPANLALHFSAPTVPLKMPPAIEIVCFRIAQEALTNVLRHAGARNVWIELAADGDGLRLAVRDDGKGFDLAEAHRRAVGGGSIGLLSMEERAALADGRIEIGTAPGMGTTVRAMFSLQAAQSTVDTA